MICLLGAGILLGRLLPPGPFIHGPFIHGPGIAQQLLTFDGTFYHAIALHGYDWNPAIGGTFGHGQNLAFFPAYPVIEALLRRLTGSQSPLLMIGAGLFFALWSNLVFWRLAISLLPPPAAAWATLFFAVWPANCFPLMDYPVALANLCAVSCLWHYLAGRPGKALLWSGLGTAAAPGAVFIAAAICADLSWKWLHNPKTLRATARRFAEACLSVWGLLAFMLFQAINFGNPFAFLAAQRGFTESPSLPQHVFRFLNPAWYLFPLRFTATTLSALLHPGPLAAAQRHEMIGIAWQLDQDLLIMILAIFLLRRGLRALPPVIWLAGLFVCLGYLWFIATGTFNLLCGMRMLYPALAFFFMLGLSAGANRIIGPAILAWLALSSIAAAALVMAGYGFI
jgi:hypothetical protein